MVSSPPAVPGFRLKPAGHFGEVNDGEIEGLPQIFPRNLAMPVDVECAVYERLVARPDERLARLPITDGITSCQRDRRCCHQQCPWEGVALSRHTMNFALGCDVRNGSKMA